MAEVVFSVSQINEYLGRKLYSDPFLSRVSVVGEVTNFSMSSIGHAFFSLKDDTSMIDAIMYDFETNESKNEIVDGAMIRVRGRVTYYKKTGSVQLAVERAQALGTGDLFAKFEQTKKKLLQEGLFDPAHKKPIPPFPLRIGVVTSAAGAAVQDIINVATRRFDGVRIAVYPAQVQGTDAARQVAAGISYFNRHMNVDVLIVGRGGGSFEDLFAFNEEIVARAVYDSDIPVVSAVGHETDFSLCDMAADLRAPTPSAAAELVVPDKQSVAAFAVDFKQKLGIALSGVLESAQGRLEATGSRVKAFPLKMLWEQKKSRIGAARQQMHAAAVRQVEKRMLQIERFQSDLMSLDPRGVLGRGYAIVYDEAGGVVASATSAAKDMQIEFLDGRMRVSRKDSQ